MPDTAKTTDPLGYVRADIDPCLTKREPGDPTRLDDMQMFASWAGRLQRALNSAATL